MTHNPYGAAPGSPMDDMACLLNGFANGTTNSLLGVLTVVAYPVMDILFVWIADADKIIEKAGGARFALDNESSRFEALH